MSAAIRLDGCERVDLVEFYTGTDGRQLALIEADYHDGFGPIQIAVTTDRLVVTA
ncbi:hypothetical protein M1M07_23865 [Rhodococcus sp. HM1]|uniref:hypothetical protein n=1 Tax=Rhodococcus sp. HM1 TaxID=2937759 RepID=UPI00200B7BD3|nr:hypothetical protein [Rhodococcus sp. HM1]MCK8674135.1 hypothetical protein [Rhodococcus sp. HM1]